MAFVHLHVHSQYSMLDGTADVGPIARAASEAGHPAVALTDSGNLFGAVLFAKACKDKAYVGANKVSPVLGAELFVQPEGLQHVEGVRGGFHVLALVEDDEGYKNLCQLVTDGIMKGMAYKPRVDLAAIERHRGGLVFLAGGRAGPFGRPLLAGDATKARSWMRSLSAALGPEQLFVELTDLGIPGDEAVNALGRELSAELHRPLVVTNAVHYLKPEDCAVHEALNAIACGCSLQSPNRFDIPTDQAYFKTEAEMRDLFPDDGDAIERTVAIANRCHFKFKEGYHFPAAVPPNPEVGADTVGNWEFFYKAFPPPIVYGLPAPEEMIPEKPPGAGNLDGYFAWYARCGLDLRLKDIASDLYPAYRERLEWEIGLIAKMQFPAYMLIVAEFINWSKDAGIPVGPGRGSAAGSLVAWSMRITDIDPIRFELLFERFLNPERVSMPDIDVDFAQDRREEAIQHVRKKYGEAFVSQIITYGRLKAKAAVRDVARVVDLSFNDADEIAKLVPDGLDVKLPKAIETEEKLAIRLNDPKVRRVLAVAQAVEGMCRQTGVHAAGVVIADRPLVEYAPLYVDEPGNVPAVQFDMKSAETVGLIKFDFLGLKTLDQVRDTVVAIKKNHGVDVDMSRLPIDDLPTYALLKQGDVLGVFQLESDGMRRLLVQLAPGNIDEIIALVALYRPGPLETGMVSDFVDRKHGRKKVEYPLPMLEPILKPTYGTIVYQEQVMQCAQVMALYSLGEADLLRRAMGKKNPAEMAKERPKFVQRSIENHITPEKAGEVFDLLEKFAGYGFNKSHSAAYGYISYQTAYLKARYRPEFTAALLTIDAGDADKVLMYVEDARQAGIKLLPVCLNHSDLPFTANKDGTIRFGLCGVKGVGTASIEAIVEARKAAGGKFKDVMDFFERVDQRRINKKVVECLVKAGAFDFLGVPRAAMLWRPNASENPDDDGPKESDTMERAMAAASRVQEDRLAGQVSLFGGSAPIALPKFRFPDVKEWPVAKKLAFEREVVGLYLTGHPMQAHAREVERYATHTLGDLSKLSAGAEVRVIGLPTDLNIARTQRGDKWASARLEDQHGAVRVLFFSEAWSRSQRSVESEAPILVVGRLKSRGEGAIELHANTCETLSEVRARLTSEVRFRLGLKDLEGDRLDRFHAVLAARRGPCRARLFIRVDSNAGDAFGGAGRYDIEMDLPDHPVDPDTALEEDVVSLFGRPDVVAFS